MVPFNCKRWFLLMHVDVPQLLSECGGKFQEKISRELGSLQLLNHFASDVCRRIYCGHAPLSIVFNHISCIISLSLIGIFIISLLGLVNSERWHLRRTRLEKMICV